MRFLRRFFIRLSNFVTGRRADQRLQEEMAEHLALQTEENLRAGMSPSRGAPAGHTEAWRGPGHSRATPRRAGSSAWLRIFSSISATLFACCTGLPDFP